MRGTRARQHSEGYIARPAVEGTLVAGQRVKYQAGSRIYFGENRGTVARAIPVDHATLSSDWLYNAHVGVKEGKRITGVRDTIHTRQAIETILAQAVPGLGDQEVLYVVPAIKKEPVLRQELRERPIGKTILGQKVK